MITIYTLEDPITKEVRYIGKTKKELVERMYSHISNYRLKKEKSHKNSWIKSLKQKNLKPIIKELDLVKEEDWEFWEQFYINLFKSWGFNLTNMTKGGEGSLGGKGCLGYICFGPIGLLCGLLGMGEGKTKTTTYRMCGNCGARFK